MYEDAKCWIYIFTAGYHLCSNTRNDILYGEQIEKYEGVEVFKIKAFFENIRKPRKNIPFNSQVAITLGIILFGFVLGVLQKWKTK